MKNAVRLIGIRIQFFLLLQGLDDESLTIFERLLEVRGAGGFAAELLVKQIVKCGKSGDTPFDLFVELSIEGFR